MTIRIHSRIDGQPTEWDGCWVAEYNPRMRGVDPDGERWCHLVVTDDPAKARQFRDLREATNYLWQDTGRLRADGQPDRPLTAYTVEIS
jgi:hypothetical protein